MLVNRDVTKRQHPEALRPFLPELSDFAKKNHEILHTILRYVLPPSDVAITLYLIMSGFLQSVWKSLKKPLLTNMGGPLMGKRIVSGSWIVASINR